MSDEFVLTRTGQAPLAFSGKLLVEQSSHIVNGQDHNRWHDVRIYRTAGGAYVVEVVYCTQWQGEQDYHWVLEAGDASSVEMRLREIGCEINSPVKGYPPGTHYEERQTRMLHDLQQRFEVCISEVLGVEDEFAERIE